MWCICIQSILHVLVLWWILCVINITNYIYIHIYIYSFKELKFLPNLKYKTSLNSKMHAFNIVLHFLFRQLLVEIYCEKKAGIELETKRFILLSEMLLTKREKENAMSNWRSCALNILLGHILSHENIK